MIKCSAQFAGFRLLQSFSLPGNLYRYFSRRTQQSHGVQTLATKRRCKINRRTIGVGAKTQTSYDTSINIEQNHT